MDRMEFCPRGSSTYPKEFLVKVLTRNAAPEPPSDPYAAYRVRYQSLMARSLSAMQRSLQLTARK